jgi:hypothetical protein
MAAPKNAAAAVPITNYERPYMTWGMPANNIGARTPNTRHCFSPPQALIPKYTTEAAGDTEHRKRGFEGIAMHSPIRSEVKLDQQGDDDTSRAPARLASANVASNDMLLRKYSRRVPQFG